MASLLPGPAPRVLGAALAATALLLGSGQLANADVLSGGVLAAGWASASRAGRLELLRLGNLERALRRGTDRSGWPGPPAEPPPPRLASAFAEDVSAAPDVALDRAEALADGNSASPARRRALLRMARRLAESGGDAAAERALESYGDRPGVPVVAVDLICPRGGVPRMVLSQSASVAGPGSGSSWTVPLWIRYGGQDGARTIRLVLDTPEATVEFPGPDCPSWIMPDDGATAFALVAPSRAVLSGLLSDGLGELTPTERAALAAGFGLLARQGRLPAGRALQLLAAFAADPDPVVFGATARQVARLAELVPKCARPGLARYVERTFGPRGRDLGLGELARRGAPQRAATPGDESLRDQLRDFLEGPLNF